ncbi:MAG: M14 family zinc carboxypeptidase [Gemmatimonadota bacterium]|jgi:hypothetical protein
MNKGRPSPRRLSPALAGLALLLLSSSPARAQQAVIGTRDPAQKQDSDFAKAYREWTSEPRYGSPLVDHLPSVDGIPTPKDVLGHWVGAPKTLTYYADIVRYYRALEAASPRVRVETIGRSDEGRELVVVWVSSEANIEGLDRNRANLARIADPRGLSDEQVRDLIETTKPNYHLMGGLHSGETGPSEMLMELAYRLVAETSPLINRIRDNVIVSITPVADPDGRDRFIDWFYQGLEIEANTPEDTTEAADSAAAQGGGRGGRGGRSPGVPYWGRYVYHDNNRDINLSQVSMRALTDWYYTAHPPIMHDLHESMTLLYTYSGGPPQNPNLDPLLFAELPWFSNWELAQMTKWGMPGVYTHAFMDGWSPGYLGSVSYNHNGVMRMYETQSGRDVDLDSLAAAVKAREDSAAARDSAGAGGRGGRGSAAAAGGRGGTPAGGRGGAQAGGRGGIPMGRGGGVPTGRGGGQNREWYRGIAVPTDAVSKFTRRNNTNYMETAVLSALQLTAMFPNLVLENFWVKTRNSIDDGKDEAPFAYAIPVQREMTRAVTLVNILRAQGIEVGRLSSTLELDEDTLPAGSFVIKLDQPYGRLAKNLLEKQDYPDPALRTYDDSGWSMGFAFNVDVREIDDREILDAKTTPVDSAEWHVPVAGDGTAGLAVAHLGSNNMIAFRYRLRTVPMKIAEQAFTAEDETFPAGSFIVSGSPAVVAEARAVADSLGLTAAALDSLPAVPSHDGDAPRVAIYSQWSGTQDLGWYRHAFDRFGIPFDLIYKERVMEGDLRRDYDVIVMAAQNINRTAVLAEPADQPRPYEQTDTYAFLGMYGSSPDITGGFGQEGVEAFEAFLEGGGTLIAADNAVRFPIEFGFAHTIDTESISGINAQKPLVEAKIARAAHPVFYGWADSIFPLKFGDAQVFRVGVADQDAVLARYVGGDDSVLSGLMVGADAIAGRAFAVDVPEAYHGRGRVILFANNPIYRWQNHGEFNMVFNSILNWNDVPAAKPLEATTSQQ